MIFSYVVVLTCVWWIIFYMALPFGAQVTAKPELGHADGAPTKANLGIKVIITSIIAIILTILIVYLIEHDYLARFVDNYLKMLNF